jgi:hypothetical protein
MLGARPIRFRKIRFNKPEWSLTTQNGELPKKGKAKWQKKSSVMV